MITPLNILRHELIGLEVQVVHARNTDLNNIAGTVIDETKNTVLILTISGRKRVAKNGVIFRFTLPSGIRVDVEGSILVLAPERRISMKVRLIPISVSGIKRGQLSSSVK